MIWVDQGKARHGVIAPKSPAAHIPALLPSPTQILSYTQLCPHSLSSYYHIVLLSLTQPNTLSVPKVTSHTKVSPPLILFRQQGLSEALPPHFQTNTLLSFPPYPSIPSPSCRSRSEGIPFIFLLYVQSLTRQCFSKQSRPPPQHSILNTNSLLVSFLI
jgi:hypothetical protein